MDSRRIVAFKANHRDQQCEVHNSEGDLFQGRSMSTLQAEDEERFISCHHGAISRHYFCKFDQGHLNFFFVGITL